MSDSRLTHRVQPRALWDLEEIFLYTLEHWSLQQADDYYRHIVACISDLAIGRQKGRKIDHIRQGYSILPCQSHYIIYRSNIRSVTIIRILHRRMNIGAHL